MAEHKSIKLLWVPRHMEIDGNTKKKFLPIYSQNLSWHLVYLQKSLEGWWRTRWAENIWNIGSPQVHRGRLWDLFYLFKKKKKAWDSSTSAQTQLRIKMRLLTGHCNIKAHLFKVGLVNSPGCNKCKQASEIASHILCGCEALATFRFRPLHYHFMKPGNSEDTAVSTIPHFFKVQSSWMHELVGCAKDWKWSKCMGHCLPLCFLLNSILF